MATAAQLHGSAAARSLLARTVSPRCFSERFRVPDSRSVSAAAFVGSSDRLIAERCSIFFDRKLSQSLRLKANSMTKSTDPSASVQHSDGAISSTDKSNTTFESSNAATALDKDLSVQSKKYAKIHDFCLGIPFGGFLFSMGVIAFLVSRSPASIVYGIGPGFGILALAVLSLRTWKTGKSCTPFIVGQAGIASALAWKHFQAYTLTKKALPWGFYAVLSAAMVGFYSYVLLAGGNPPSKKKNVAALS